MCTGRHRLLEGLWKQFVVDQICGPGALDFRTFSRFANEPVEAPARSYDQDKGARDERWS